MIIAMTILIITIALYVVFLEVKIRKVEADVKTLFEINSIMSHMIDIVNEQVDILAEVTGIKKEKGD